MKNLINTIKKIEIILCSLEVISKKEYHSLLNPDKFNNLDILKTVKKKTMLFKTLTMLNQERKSLEKKYSIFEPYQNIVELNNDWNQIINKCLSLRQFNLKNKILINKKFYLNQYFLELFSSHKKSTTYNIDGNINI
ncbi:MAG: flagellar biosynthesis protein FlgN [Buchnera aphidicola (Microlophium carnosum)]|uniref:Flagellar biosynthesis protein FlgN n=1 Tax=Buchnera aphidicola (Microlophium carnosum) TaxID=2708354 RepID=A0A6G9JVN8_9GAMM|nr:MAG: flagellar biosynthesis protein FlgN [Buchnera aphidicola (Microlophium carnosum)]